MSQGVSDGPRIGLRGGTGAWEQDLAPRDAPAHGRADAWGELNHVDADYLEVSRASAIPRGVMLCVGIVGVLMAALLASLPVKTAMHSGEVNVLTGVALAAPLLLLVLSVFFLRFDLRLPKDRPVRFNRRQRKVYANEYRWTGNPFGRWGGEARTFEWNTLQAEITKQISASGEVVTQRYALDLVACRPGPDVGTVEEFDRLRVQEGAQTTVQYEELWELIRRYMAEGPGALPPQTLRVRRPGFVDCLLFAMPWFAPTDMGREARRRMRGVLGTLMAVLMSLLFPLWLVFGLGNYVVMRIAPETTWPPGMDEASTSAR